MLDGVSMNQFAPRCTVPRKTDKWLWWYDMGIQSMAVLMGVGRLESFQRLQLIGNNRMTPPPEATHLDEGKPGHLFSQVVSWS